MKKAAKSIVTLFLVLVSVVSMFSIGALATTEDHDISVSVSAGTTYTTAGAKKENTSCVYCWPRTAPTSYMRIVAGGSNAEIYTGDFNVATTGAGYLSLTVGTKYSIHTYINEIGFTYAKIRMYAVSSGTHAFRWSADSSGSYVDAN